MEVSCDNSEVFAVVAVESGLPNSKQAPPSEGLLKQFNAKLKPLYPYPISMDGTNSPIPEHLKATE